MHVVAANTLDPSPKDSETQRRCGAAPITVSEITKLTDFPRDVKRFWPKSNKIEL